jgi:hypothetical protein
MKLGAEPKKVAILAGLMVVAIIVYFMNSAPSGPSAPSGSEGATARPAIAPRPPSQPAVDVPGRPVQQAASQRGSSRQGRVLQEFRPSLKPKKPEDRPDPTTVDPTLHLDVLSKLQSVTIEGSHRSVFEFGQAPPPPLTKDEIARKKQPVPDPMLTAKAAVPAPPSGPPPPPPIPLKFFGYVSPVSAGGNKRAFFLEGDDVHVVNEGDLVKRRYKIVRIGVNSVVVEDTQFKNQQTLPLEEQQG